MSVEIMKLDENKVTITRTEEKTVDFETLTAQKAGILAQQEQEEQNLIAANAGRAMVLAEIDLALGKGITAKPEPIKEEVVVPVEEIIT